MKIPCFLILYLRNTYSNLINTTFLYITTIIEDLIYEYEVLKEELEDFKQDMEDNYIKRPMSDYTGNADDDRF